MTMDASTYKLVDGGWTTSQSENGYTLTAQFYCKTQQSPWPKRGDAVPTTGAIAVPSGFSSYVLSEVTVTPLTSVGPWIIDVTARRKLGYNTTGGNSLTEERKVSVENRPYFVMKEELTSWPSALPNFACERTFDFALIDYYKTTGTSVDLDGPRDGIVTGIPSWCDISTSSGKWRINSCRVEKVYDTNGVTTLKHIQLELIGVPSSLGTTWSSSRYSSVAFSSI